MMKELIIGRNNACDIIIPDTSDLISRKQAVLRYSFSGKMLLFDNGKNGTYINGQRIEQGRGYPVTRKDKISFARITDLDWSQVKDPYLGVKKAVAVCAAVVLLVIAALLWWFMHPSNAKSADPVQTEIPAEKGETFTTVGTPAAEEQPDEVQRPSPAPKKTGKTKKTKKNSDANKATTKEVDRNSPIVY